MELSFSDKKSVSEVLKEDKKGQLIKEKEYGSQEKIKSEGELNNLLIQGDNLPVMRHLLENPKVKGKVTLVYIDPPFGIEHDFELRGQGRNKPTYKDSFEGDEYFKFLWPRLILLKELLSEKGSIYVHLGLEKAGYVKVLIDELFGSENFRNWISRKSCHSKNFTKNQYGSVQDCILFYSKSEMKWSRPYKGVTERMKKEYRYVEEETGRRYMKVPIYANGERNGKTGEKWRGMDPPEGKHWFTTPEKLDKLDEEGKIVWSSSGNPRKKVYLDEREGAPVTDIWTDFQDQTNQMQSITGYPTEKNEEMLKRILKASSEKGDIVLDSFAGSGTTLAAAEKLNRRWIGIDNNEEAIKTTTNRLMDIDNVSVFQLNRLKE